MTLTLMGSRGHLDRLFGDPSSDGDVDLVDLAEFVVSAYQPIRDCKRADVEYGNVVESDARPDIRYLKSAQAQHQRDQYRSEHIQPKIARHNHPP